MNPQKLIDTAKTLITGDKGLTELRPLLKALIDDDGSSWLREGAHHVLRIYNGDLNKPLEQLLNALDDKTVMVTVTVAASAAFESVDSIAAHDDSNNGIDIASTVVGATTITCHGDISKT